MSDSQTATSGHAPIATLDEMDSLDEAGMAEGCRPAEKGGPEPGGNHSRAYHHGWRTRMMDPGEIPIPREHHELVRQLLARGRKRSAR
jgi:hypothetical protein